LLALLVWHLTVFQTSSLASKANLV
jgi:hypothetical protein